MPRRCPDKPWSLSTLARVATAGLLIGACAPACQHVEPPTPAGSPSVALPEWPVSPSLQPPAVEAEAASSGLPLAVAVATAQDAAAASQTGDLPRASGRAFDARAQALWDAIVQDDPDRALAFFFPLRGYKLVKDVADPEADWKHRLIAAYRRDIHALHQRLGDDAPQAIFVAVAVPEGRAQWIEPGQEWNRLGYFRVYGSVVHYRVGGMDRFFPIKSMISWRGEWYVVHLSSFGKRRERPQPGGQTKGG